MQVRRVLIFLLKPIVLLICLLESALFLLRQRKALSEYSLVYPFWTWSFGHTIVGVEFAARLYYPQRVALLYVPHSRSNTLFAHCFQDNMTCFVFRSRLPPLPHTLEALKFAALRFWLLLWTAVTQSFHVLDQVLGVYPCVPLASNTMLQGNNALGALDKHTDWTGLIRLQRDKIGVPPKLPPEAIDRCRRAFEEIDPAFFSKPFVTVLLRSKSNGQFDDEYRSSGPPQNYLPALEFLSREGFNIVATGETAKGAFGHLPGFVDSKSLAVPYEEINLFVLMHCALFIGQQSGPLLVPNACGIPCLICDSVPYRLGTNNSDDLVLFKHMSDKTSGRRLSYVEVFREHQDLAFGYNFTKKNIVVQPNTAEEILAGARETVARMRGNLKLTTDELKLVEAFHRLPPREMPVYYHGNRPPLATLQTLRQELLNS